MSNTTNSLAQVKLRDYQDASIEAVRAEIRKGRKRVLLCVPTGGGKTLTSASILASAVAKSSRVGFIAHRLELIDQTVRTFARLGVDQIGVIRGQDPRRNLKAPIQVASIQTLSRRPGIMGDVQVIVVDECHRSYANTYRKHIFEAYPNAVILGLTATPCRTDGKPLGELFEALVIGARYSELIAEGHILAPIVYGTPISPDLTRVRTTAGDYNLEDLEEAVNRSAIIGNIVAEWKRHSAGRRTVVFAVSVAHSHALRDAFIEAGARAGHVDGTTPEDERRATLARLDAGELDIVCNVGVLCEGWDMPSCKCLVLARPTKSLALYMQMAGRILRPWGDSLPLILDHGGNVDRHGMPHQDRDWSLESRVAKSAGVAPCKACPACFCYVAAGSKVCPLCGHKFVMIAGVDFPEPEVLPVDLALRTLDGPDAQLSFFRALVKTASERGWKLGAIWHKYRERWGEDPPNGWMPAARKGHKLDAEWQAKIATREQSSPQTFTSATDAIARNE